MPTFAYTARDSNGAAAGGTLMAASAAEVSQMLRAEGKFPTDVRLAVGDAAGAAAAGGGAGVVISRAEVIQLSTQLSIMIETGVTLTEALECIAAQSESPKVRRLVADVVVQVQSGSDFSTAVARHPRSFPRLYVALIRASEQSGMMSKMLTRATAYMRDEQETVRRVKGALVYPGIMLAFAVSTTVFLLAFVLPKFTSIYASKGAALPLPTKILMGLSDTLLTRWWLILLVGGGMSAACYAYKRTPGGLRAFHWLQLHVPLFGNLFRKLHLSRTLRMVGTMAGAGVNLVDCVNTANDLCDNVYFKDLWSDVSTKIQAGKPLCEPLFDCPLVPRSVAQMIHSGEKSGKLAFVMETVSGFAEQELKETIAELTRYIEPAMIVIMGVIIGGVALALLLPIFTISRVVAN